jgi:Asp-tRNA(Asn)/Glu-tRNA(Gln) amidotransferase A subunit family amidase
MDASEAAQRIRDGVLTSEELVQECLERIRALEPKVQAWQFLDEEHALAQARACDERKRSGEPIGPLHGVPVGVKDIIDTADMPTENGTVLHEGRTPRDDAAVVRMLRAAGAVILGKTVTTECAYFNPGKTRNPHNAEHTPPDRRLGDPSGGVLRRVRLQANARPDPADWRPRALAHVGSRWTFRAKHRRPGAPPRAASRV